MQSEFRRVEAGRASNEGEVEDFDSLSSVADTLLDQARQLIALARSIDPAVEWQRIFGNAPLEVSAASRTETSRGSKSSPDIGSLARATYRARRIRDSIFKEDDLFGEPAWDMLLDLACAKATGARISVSSACIGSCVPPTTGLRWLAILEKKGLVTREEDAFDKRRAYVRLSPLGLSKMKDYFRNMRSL